MTTWIAIAVFLTGVVVIELRARRWRAAAFWAIVAAPFAAGEWIPPEVMGGGVIALALLVPKSKPIEERVDAPRGKILFVPALAIPALTVALAFVLGDALLALALACIAALALALAVTRAPPQHAFGEGRRLLDAIGWAAVLPMLLATLGTVFAQTGVGDAIAELVTRVIPVDNRLACVAAYAAGMVVFTAIMGNAFAAFPVMTAGIGLPLLVRHHGADPAALGALGMVTGYCGTLLTPMAANFNLVPAALLELRDEYGVIRAQWPTALVLLAFNLVLLAKAT